MNIIRAFSPKHHLRRRPSKRSPQRRRQQTKDWDRSRPVEIVRGDTLRGLTRKYGVSINAMKEANGIQGDTIYAGKKLITP
ncbi:hypothetical protein OPV22_020384 [Ensete ventricosum]|uniref:LysM domain-containing protein n=1 Tax=Ensete ventricosum TaxID=4639 RepID=A0AAV8QL84_ENSVE|nr:hypothetical protein OPV22_020384 [Ensete ventricosum]